MRADRDHHGQHRLGMPNGVHCIEFPEVAFALAEHRRTWFTMLVSQGRHSFASMRKRTAEATATYWVPAPAALR
ncbi:hypothetical protein QM716_24545 [Rhodococcus sp. IEGM 1409]|uniref:hypothetical protein n=1 Tax=Rhodococcus sp. IEGM 1409 TaxID=3047082 RepID=UPI0024B68741|nr:hypothetical protein [Rhodococcus sp. IEGM 1409]MDI9903027.1 hypothetical protein [Rhodococcus sp. IEGM 1409]